jgi:hypothetical protein
MERATTALTDRDQLVVDGQPISSIRQINNLSPEIKADIYRSLVPPEALTRFGISASMVDDNGQSLFECACEPTTSSVTLAVRHQHDARDPVIYLEMADMSVNELEILLLVINDPKSERFDVDVMPDGTSTGFGLECRNIEEEVRAMQAGLAPGQIRHGARLARRLVPRFERSVSWLGHDRVHIRPLGYHSALLFERYGFSYSIGRGKMEWIHAEFSPGGFLHSQMDGSTPFRQPDSEDTVRGRSWAIHDGILGEPFGGIRMYKRVDIHAGVCTFPLAKW